VIDSSRSISISRERNSRAGSPSYERHAPRESRRSDEELETESKESSGGPKRVNHRSWPPLWKRDHKMNGGDTSFGQRRSETRTGCQWRASIEPRVENPVWIRTGRSRAAPLTWRAHALTKSGAKTASANIRSTIALSKTAVSRASAAFENALNCGGHSAVSLRHLPEGGSKE
jgi:hypothetical protein